MGKSSRLVILSVVLALWHSISASFAAENYPSRPVRIVVPGAAGGVTDAHARKVADILSRSLGQQFVIENKPGALGMIAAEYVARANPDGYTLLLGNGSTLCINPAIRKALSYDSIRDFMPITFANRGNPVLIVSATLPIKNLSEFIAYGKSHPGEMAYGSPGSGSPQHFAGEMFSRMTGIRMTHVPYKNQAQIITDLMGGTIQATVEFAATAIPAVKSGKALGLVVAGPKRKPALADVPTAKEVGLKDFEVTSWNGYLAPKGTPTEVISILHKAITGALKSSAYSTWAAETGVEVVASTPAEFAQILKEEMQRWKAFVHDSGIVIE